MSIDGTPLPSRTRPGLLGRVLSFCWRLGDRGGPVPLLAVAAAGMVVVQLARPIHDVDIFWQLKLGDLTLADGLPKTEPFIAGKQNEPLAVVAWLSQVVYAATRQVGGWTLLWLVDALVWFGGFVVVALAWGRGRRNVWPAVVGLWLGWLAALPSASLRPQSFSALAFGLLLALIRANLSVGRTAALGTLLFVAWQNLHPSAVVGGGIVGVAAVAELARKRLPWRLLVLLPAAAVTTVATPAGFDIFRISAVNAAVSRSLAVAEWEPLTWQPLEYGRPYAWAALFVTLVGVTVRGRRLDAKTFAMFLMLTAAMLLSHRFVLFWGIVVVATWAELCRSGRGFARPDTSGHGAPVSGLEDSARPTRSRLRLSLAAVAILVGVLAPALFNPAPFGDHYPFAAIEALRAAEVRGTVYCSYVWGGIVTDAGHPNWRVSHDGRYYLFIRSEWDEYFRTARGEVEIDALVANHRPAAFFLRPGTDDGLIQRLQLHRDWRQLFADENAVVFVPRKKPNTISDNRP